jgi:hypothetical protein
MNWAKPTSLHFHHERFLMLTQALIFLETFMGLFARPVGPLLHAGARAGAQPTTAFLVALTNWLVVPCVASSPECGVWTFRPWCLPATEVLLLGITFWLRGFDFGPALGTSLVLLGLLGAVAIIKLTLYILMAAVIVRRPVLGRTIQPCHATAQ